MEIQQAPLCTIAKLAAKIASVMGELDGVKKGGHNNFQNYDYITESDVANMLRPLLAKYKIVILPNIIQQERHKIERNNKLTYLTDVTVEYTIIDGDSGETVKLKFMGTGEDNTDKGIYKALTGCHKYFFLRTFHLGSDEDPENDSKEAKIPPRKTIPASNIKPKDVVAAGEMEVPQETLLGSSPTKERFKVCDAWFKHKPKAIATAMQIDLKLKRHEAINPYEEAFLLFGHENKFYKAENLNA